MKIKLLIGDSKIEFNNLKALRKYLLSFTEIPQVKSLIIDGREISFFGLCYFIAHGNLPGR
jgi:hypothetical protein